MILLVKILDFLLSMAFNLFSMLVIIRLYMQFAKVSFANPIGQTVIKTTNWLVLPFQKILPKLRALDLPSLIAAYLCSLLSIVFLYLLHALLGNGPDVRALLTAKGIVITLSWAMLNLIKLTIYILTAVIFVRVIFSWIRPNSPTAWFVNQFTQQMSAPLIRPVQKLLPKTGGLDFSPFIVLLILQIALIVVTHYLVF